MGMTFLSPVAATTALLPSFVLHLAVIILILDRYDMYKDIEEKLAKKKNVPFTDKFICGLPIGLKLSNGTTVSA
jgi:hypothetical protein